MGLIVRNYKDDKHFKGLLNSSVNFIEIYDGMTNRINANRYRCNPFINLDYNSIGGLVERITGSFSIKDSFYTLKKFTWIVEVPQNTNRPSVFMYDTDDDSNAILCFSVKDFFDSLDMLLDKFFEDKK